jgi:VWFA-related protein
MSTRCRRLTELLLLGALAGFPSAAQPPDSAPNAPEVSTHDAPATFRTGVNLVLVPVVVRDRQGRAIGTLHQEDFQLLDKGKLQIITRFAVEKPGSPATVTTAFAEQDAPAQPPGDPAAPAGPPPVLAEHFIAYLFDDIHLDIGDLQRAREAAKRQLSESLTPTTRVAIYTTSGRTTQDFTNDGDQLQTTLNHILPWTSATRNGAQECPDIDLYQADLIQNKNDPQALAAAISEFMACNPGVPQSAAQAVAQATASRVVNTGEHETQLALTVLRDVVRRMTASPGSRSIVLVSSGFFVTQDYRTNESDLMDRAIRANVTINSLDARGLYAIIPGGDASQGPSNPGTMLNLKTQYQMSSALANADIMAELSSATGGTFFHNNNALGEGFEKLTQQPEFLYVLGFSPQNLKLDGSFHGLKVSVKSTPGLTLEARRGYYAPLHAADPTQTAKEEVREALFSRDEQRDIPVDLNMQFFKSSEVNAKLSVIARVDLRALHFRKAEGRNLDILTVVAGLFDSNGNYVSGMEKTVDMRLRDQTYAALPASGITVKNTFDLMPGNYSIRLVVRDSEGQMMTARNGAVRIP